jgi:hypothetical protein
MSEVDEALSWLQEHKDKPLIISRELAVKILVNQTDGLCEDCMSLLIDKSKKRIYAKYDSAYKSIHFHPVPTFKAENFHRNFFVKLFRFHQLK